LSEDARAIKQLTDQRIDWAQKLNQLSLKLPSGIWFTSISISPSSLTLSGSVVSLQKQEMALIKRFMDSLKNDKDFFKDFSSLELSSVKTRTIVTYEVVDFNLIGNLKSKL